MQPVKVREKAWSVASGQILAKIKPGMPEAQIEAIKEEANNQALSDCFGANWRERVQADGSIAEGGIGSDQQRSRVHDGVFR
jgi:hypothetical protein